MLRTLCRCRRRRLCPNGGGTPASVVQTSRGPFFAPTIGAINDFQSKNLGQAARWLSPRVAVSPARIHGARAPVCLGHSELEHRRSVTSASATLRRFRADLWVEVTCGRAVVCASRVPCLARPSWPIISFRRVPVGFGVLSTSSGWVLHVRETLVPEALRIVRAACALGVALDREPLEVPNLSAK